MLVLGGNIESLISLACKAMETRVVQLGKPVETHGEITRLRAVHVSTAFLVRLTKLSPVYTENRKKHAENGL